MMPTMIFLSNFPPLNSSLTNTMSTLSYIPSREQPTATRHVWTLSIPSPQSCVSSQTCNLFLRHLLTRLDTQGAFIAGVQGGLIAVTYTSHSTALDRATNWFSFVGLTLDLVGVGAGVTYALRLQETIRHTDRVTVWLSSAINSARRDVKKLQLVTNLSVATSDQEMYGRLEEKIVAISQVTTVLIKTFSRPSLDSILTTIRNIPSIVENISPTLEFFNFMLNIIVYIIKHSFHGPAVSLTGGTLCLLISVILFAGASQPLFICISCITITMSMIVLSIPSTKANSMSMSAVPVHPFCAERELID
jgi:hypothetical protein